MIEHVVKEYEHGTADPKECSGVTLEQYASVAEDLYLSIVMELSLRDD